MKLTPHIEAEIKQVMDDYWNSYFEGNLEHWGNYLVDDYRNIGGTEEEIWNSKNEILDYTYRIIDQMQGATELRNKQTQIIPYDPYIMVHELLDIFIKIEDEWTFYQKFRLSSLIQQTPEGWKVLHQHGSYPDSKTTGGEAFAFDTLKSENTKLQKAITERTVELEKKNNELAIEAALERVRAVALSMNKPADMLEVCSIIAAELDKLNVQEIRNVQTAIFYEEKGTYMNYEYYAKHDKKIITETAYTNNEIQRSFANQMLKGNGEFYSTLINNSELPAWIAYQKTTNVFIDSYLEAVATLSYYWYSLGPVALGISTYFPLREEDKNLFKRFVKVFELAYRRYLDIEKAEAQARESQIQLALERVRARTMAMQKSEELTEVAGLLFKQVTDLGISSWTAGFNVWSDDNNSYVDYITSPNGGFIEPYTVLTDRAEALRDISNARKSGVEFDVQYVEGEKIKQLYIALTGLGEEQFEKMRQDGNQFPSHQYEHFVFGSRVSLMFITYEPVPEAHDIFKRFGKVFEQTYTRFLDLQKAEAQAREAEIELALERVRARTMAMQRSKELVDVATVLFQQVKSLGVPQWNCGFNIWTIGDDEFTYYPGSPDGIISPSPCKIPLTEHPVFMRFDESRKRGDELLIYEKEGEEQADHYRYMLSLPGVGDLLKSMLDAGFELPKFQIDHLANFAYGNLIFITYEHFPKMHDVFKRFAKVFEQTYTRFLDLQKAEAQARESQIQLALERVRARAMAMQSADELIEVANTMREQMGRLNQPELETMAVHLYKDNSEYFESWYAFRDGDKPADKIFKGNAKFKKDSCAVIREFVEDYYSNKKEYTIEVSGARREEWFNVLTKAAPEIMEAIYARLDDVSETTYFHFSDFSGGSMLMVSYQPPSEESCHLQRRASAVFDLAYRRFLDLQKAEAQAREAQIELGLERVRAKAMAMQSSSELAELVDTVFKELTKLDLLLDRCIIMLYDAATKDSTWWIAAPETDALPIRVLVKYHEYPPYLAYIDAWQKRILKWRYVLEGSNKKEWDNFIFSDTEMALLSTAVKDGMMSFEKIFLNVSFNNFGSLTASSFDLLPEEQFDILLRFAKVFDSTYTRFNDLQKAEAQAREAQIQLALERVRARTMAMQHSNELAEAASLLFQQVKTLGIETFSSGYTVWANEDKDLVSWMCNADGSMNPPFVMPVNGDIRHVHMFQSWKSGEAFYVEDMSGETMQEHYAYLRSFPLLDEAFKTSVAAGYTIPPRQVHNIANFSLGNLLFITYDECPDYHGIFFRFAKVFEQTYTRFLDLKRAEEQAREAQIQLAMERVRARTMAMQRSNELADAASLLFKLISDFGIQIWSSAFQIWNDDDISSTAWASAPDGSIQPPFRLPYNEDNYFKKIYEARQRGEDFFVMESSGKELEETYHYMFNLPGVKEYFDDAQELGFQIPKYQITHCAFFPTGYLMFITYEPCPEMWDIFKRFAKVFEQTYTRFLDLQKAEASAREAKIEMALEKIRSRTMAMQHSDELPEAANLLFLQVQALGIPAWSCGYNVLAENKKTSDCWMSSEGAIQAPFTLYFIEEASFLKWHDFLQSEESFFVQELGGKELVHHYDYMRTIPQLGEVLKALEDAGISLPTYQINHLCKYASGFLLFITYEPVPHAHDLFRRFTKVFEQTYTRFLDLQKAEAQAREAQIEAALEKVRSHSLAMYKSDDLQDVVNTVFERLKHLGIEIYSANIAIFAEGTRDFDYWIASPSQHRSSVFHIPYVDFGIIKDLVLARETGLDFFEKTYVFEEKNAWFNYGFEYTDFKLLNEERKKFILDAPSITVAIAFSKNTGVQFNRYSANRLVQDEVDVLKRFSKVFEQAYTRFLDLQKAEAQAKEAKIEAALERVRSRSLAMHNTSELQDVVNIVAQQLHQINIDINGGVFITINDEVGEQLPLWASQGAADYVQKVVVPPLEEPFFKKLTDAISHRKDFYLEQLSHEEKLRLFKHLFNYPPWSELPQEKKNELLSREGGLCRSVAISRHTTISITDHYGEKFSDEENEVLKRFGKVLEQAYTRFLDLQRAEAQAREATIEAALEKVRGNAMAMHTSNDLSVTASMVFTELRKLGINPIRCGFGSMYRESRRAQLYSATSSVAGDGLSVVGWVELSGHPVLESIYDTWLKNEDYYPELIGEQLKLYYESLLAGLPVTVPDWQSGQKQFGSFFPFSVGCLYAWSQVPYNDDEIKVLKRFASIIDLTFRRYLELQKSEANAIEAVKQAALDRIRADIASMRTIEDLNRITPLIWNELTIIGVPFIRCGVFIMDDEEKQIHTFLSTPNGKAIAAFHLSYAMPGKIEQVLTHWQQQKIYADHWDENAFAEFAQSLVAQGALQSSTQYLSSLPANGLYLHFIPFLQGMLYVGNTNHLDGDTLALIQSVAEAFSTAYARYEDFNKLGAAKQQVDKTLLDLKQAQQQLIQSEKMASLGELTAGIAHEIQNPLNFVNNFSEVSKELLDEMKEALESGNQEDAKDIANDIIQNLEKINHHGKRADAIVKGMLQHSRTSSAVKEPTNINVLADEYLRLCYHGLRAKDKTFNATFKTDFDETLQKINIIPQDIGRVILNLLTNAFYACTERSRSAVNEKKKQQPGGYEPTVLVSTKRIGDIVEIKVGDNGNGIPQNVLDKIFQPFFTTKPTGQGTGLGLSLSYDIIKAHGGELKVETNLGEGTEFTIILRGS